MARSKQSGSAAARREQERQQRQRRDDMRVSSRGYEKSTKIAPKRRKDRSGLYMIIGVVALFAAIVGLFIFVSTRSVSQTNTNPLLKPTNADPTIVQLLTGVSQSTWEAVNTGKVTQPFQSYTGQPALKGPNGHPEFFYVGGEYCPYCAAERWAMVNALSRFGTFSKLSQMQSYEDNISTFSFYGSSYSSQYVDFVPVEVYGNALDSTGQAYVPLQQMTAAQQQVFAKYNSQQAFPFVDINNQYALVGASYAPTTLLDSSQKPLSWQTIANALSDPKSAVAQGILGTANYLTAAICNVTNQQPGSVCTSSVIQQIEHSLSKISNVAGSGPLAIVPGAGLVDQRRQLAWIG